MNAVSRMEYLSDQAPTAVRSSAVRMGLGPKQLAWLRRNIESFRQAEEQRYFLREDAMRAARMAGLV